MVAYEGGPSSGWFYWNFKMEGGGEEKGVCVRWTLCWTLCWILCWMMCVNERVNVYSQPSTRHTLSAFAEWDYLRGVREGWIPVLPKDRSALDLFGTCESIIFRTDDDESIVHEFPDPEAVAPDWQAVTPDDDVVVSHGQSLLRAQGGGGGWAEGGGASAEGAKAGTFGVVAALVGLAAMFAVARCAVVRWRKNRGYAPIPT